MNEQEKRGLASDINMIYDANLSLTSSFWALVLLLILLSSAFISLRFSSVTAHLFWITVSLYLSEVAGVPLSEIP